VSVLVSVSVLVLVLVSVLVFEGGEQQGKRRWAGRRPSE